MTENITAPQSKSAVVNVRLTPDQKSQLDADVSATPFTPSHYIRALLGACVIIRNGDGFAVVFREDAERLRAQE